MENKELDKIKSMNIYEKLQLARVKLQESNLKKTGYNKFANFKYYELADFLPTVNKIFEELKLFSQFNITNEIFEEIGEGEIKEKAILKIINADDPEEVLEFETPIEEAGMANKIQGLGAKHTYLKRYLYMNALEIVENDIIDSLDNTQEVKKAKPKKETKDLTISEASAIIKRLSEDKQ